MDDWHLQSFCLTPHHANRGKRIGLSFCIKRGTGLSSTTTGSASPSRWDLRLCVLVLQQSDNYGYRIIQDTAAGPTDLNRRRGDRWCVAAGAIEMHVPPTALDCSETGRLARRY